MKVQPWTSLSLHYLYLQVMEVLDNNNANHKNYNFLDCDWFKKLFSINSLAKLSSDSLLSHSLLLTVSTVQQANHIQSCCLNQPVTNLVSITINFGDPVPSEQFAMKENVTCGIPEALKLSICYF